MYIVFDYLNSLSLFAVFLLCLIENIFIAFSAIFIGFAVDGLLKQMKQLVSIKELYWGLSTIFLNTVVTFTGYLLYKYNFIQFELGFTISDFVVDFILLFIAMDFFIYVFHYIAHKILFLNQFHELHHEYDSPTAFSLFVLHPIEVMGFGSIWLMLLYLGEFSFYAIMAYLILNVMMGMIGHLRKEFIPDFLKNNTMFKWIANTGFHVEHHQNDVHNYGFYTKVWDRIFGTLK